MFIYHSDEYVLLMHTCDDIVHMNDDWVLHFTNGVGVCVGFNPLNLSRG